MITSTMTLEEIAKELLVDFREVYDRWNRFGNKFKRICLDQTKYPWIWETAIKTKRYNEWNIIIQCMVEKGNKNSGSGFYRMFLL